MNWAVLITLVGVRLIRGAFIPAARPLILAVAGCSKLVYIGLVIALGRQYLAHQVGVSLIVDAIVVVLFVGHFIGAGRRHAAL